MCLFCSSSRSRKKQTSVSFSFVLFSWVWIWSKCCRCYDPISKHLCVSRHAVFWEHKMFYKLPHVPVSPISSINPLLDLFPDESPTSISERPPPPPPPLVFEFPHSISDVPSHASDEPPALIIDLPTDTALAMDPVGSPNSHALCPSHRVTTLPSHLHDFHCFLLLPLSRNLRLFVRLSLTLWQQAMK